MAAASGASALLVVTEWREFRSPDFEALRLCMRRPLIWDGRNLYDPVLMKQLGFEHVGSGRAQAPPRISHAPMPLAAWCGVEHCSRGCMGLSGLRDRLLLQEDLGFLFTSRIPRQALTCFMGWFSKIRNPWVCDESIAVWLASPCDGIDGGWGLVVASSVMQAEGSAFRLQDRFGSAAGAGACGLTRRRVSRRHPPDAGLSRARRAAA